MMDGRLVQQIAQLESCLMAFIVIEGRFTWTIDGMMMNAWKQEVSKSSIDSLLLSIMMRNVHVVYTTDVRDTIKWCQMMEAWARKPEHTSLDNRPGPDGGVWGRVDSRAWSKHLLMGFPGIGSKLAGAIIDHFGGVPLDWSTPVENLMKVPGIGKGKAETLIRALQRKEEQGE
jgi:ERCC4-type nuclease